jgi:hypothetical protein
MADKKISALTSLAQGDVAVTTDVLPIVDTSATETKKVTAAALVGAGLAAGVTSVDINSGSIDGTTIGANSAAAGTFTNLTASGTVSFSGATVSNGGSVTTVDINGGTIDGATIATSDITVGAGKTLNVSAGTLTLADNQISGDKVEGGTINAITINTLTSTAVNATTVDATNVEVTNVKAKDGTAAATIADSTGVVSITANPILSGGTANGVLYLNASKVATSGTGLTFNGANLGVATGTDPATITLRHTGNTSGFILKNFSGSEAQLVNADNGPMVFKTNDTEFIRLTAGGNVGIGTSSPAFKLDVNGSTGIRITGMAGVTNSAIYIPTGGILGDNIGTFEVRNGGGTSSELRLSSRGFHTFFTGGSGDLGTGTERMRLDSSGNLGIGTSTPAARVHSVDTSGYSLGLSGSTKGIRTEHNSTRSIIQGVDNTLNVSYQPIMLSGSVVELGIAGVVGATLDASGNLGLGVTPANWASGRVALQIGNTPYIIGPNIELGSNFYVNSGYKYIATGEATSYEQNAGSHKWKTAASGTAGNTITFSQAMTLDSGGRLLIGRTTSDANNYRIQISQGTATYGSGIQFVYEGVGAAAIWENSSGALCFGNDGADGDTERARITSDGYLGVGTTNPTSRLNISGTANTVGCEIKVEAAGLASGYLGPNSNGLNIGTDTAGIIFKTGVTGGGSVGNTGTERARITSGGYFKASNAGTYLNATGAYHEFRSDGTSLTLQVSNTNASPQGVYVEYSSAAPNGTGNVFLLCADNVGTRAAIRSNGGLANYQANNVDLSDVRTKKEINPAASMWDKIGALEIVTYKYNDQTHDDVNVGVIAQQVEAVEPVWVDNDGFGETPEGEEPLKTVYTKDIYFAAIKALQEAMARIEKLEAEVAALKGA